MTAALQSLESRTLFAIAGLPFKLGAEAFDSGVKIISLGGNGSIVGGYFSGTVDFDPSSRVLNLTSQGDSDIFVARYDESSRLVWADRFGGDGKNGDLENQDDAIDIAANPARGGGDFVNGYGDQPLDLGEYLNDLKLNASGGLFLAGDFIDEFDADPGSRELTFTTPMSGYYNGYIVKVDADSGALSWAKNIGGDFTDTVAALGFQANGDVVATGLFSRDVDLTVNGQSQKFNARGRADGYLMSMDSRGNIHWVTRFGSDETDRRDRETGNDLAIDTDGSIYVVGTVAGDATFTSTAGASLELNTDEHTDGFLAKYTATGRLRSALDFGGGGYDGLTHVALSAAGSASANNVVVSGYFTSDDFDADPSSRVKTLATPDDSGDQRDRTDAFIEAVRGGRTVWVQQLSGNGTEFIDGLITTSNNSVIAVGSFYDTATFGSNGPTITSERGTDDFDDNNDNDRDDSYDAFVWGLRFDGATTAVKTFGSTLDDFGGGIALNTPVGTSLLLTGRFSGEVDFDPTRTARRLRGLGFGDAFLDQISGGYFISQVAFS